MQGWGTNIAGASDRGRGRALEAKCSCVRKAVHRPLATSVVKKMVTRGY